jgi:hypothetical protein
MRTDQLWRRRLVRSAASRARGALDNLHTALCKLAERARKADGDPMALSLTLAAQHLSNCLDALAYLDRCADSQERAELAAIRAKRAAREGITQ